MSNVLKMHHNVQTILMQNIKQMLKYSTGEVKMVTSWLHTEKISGDQVQWGVYPLGTMNVCTKSHGNIQIL